MHDQEDMSLVLVELHQSYDVGMIDPATGHDRVTFSPPNACHPRATTSTHDRRTDTSVSKAPSAPFSALRSMHLTANCSPVALFRALTTSENAPLQDT